MEGSQDRINERGINTVCFIDWSTMAKSESYYWRNWSLRGVIKQDNKQTMKEIELKGEKWCTFQYHFKYWSCPMNVIENTKNVQAFEIYTQHYICHTMFLFYVKAMHTVLSIFRNNRTNKTFRFIKPCLH